MLISRLYDQDLWDSVLQSFPAPELAPLLGQLVENSWPGGQNEPGVPAPSSPRRGGTSTGLSSAGYAEGVCFGPLHPALKSFLQQLAPCNTYLRCCQLLKTWTSTNLVLGGFFSSFHLWFVWRRSLATWQRDLMLLFTIFPPWIEKPALWLRLG